MGFKTTLRRLPLHTKLALIAIPMVMLLALWPLYASARHGGDEVDFNLEASATSVTVNEEFTVNINAVAGAQTVAGADLFVDFDPSMLEVVDKNPNLAGVQIEYSGWDLSLVNSTDNTTGEIDFNGAILFSAPRTGDFVAATITFLVKGAGDGAITFSATGIRTTTAASAGDDVTGTLTGTTVTVSGPPVCSFTSADADGGDIEAGNLITFTDTSAGGPTSWSWDLNNDGSEDSALQNPTHTFNTAGTYPINLTVTNGDGTSTCDAQNVEIVAGAIATVSLDPASGSSDVGGSTTFTITGAADALTNPIDISAIENTGTITWAVINNAGLIPPFASGSSVIFTAGTVAGTFDKAIEATVAYKGGTATGNAIAVIGPGAITAVTIQEDNATVEVQGNLTFTATGVDSHGNPIAAPALLWAATTGGSIGPDSGIFTADTVPGPFAIQVTATFNGGTANDTADGTVTPGPVHHIVITNSSEGTDLFWDSQFSLAAQGFDEFNNPLSGLVFTWDLDTAAKANNGAIDSSAGSVDAPDLVGDYQAFAASGSITGAYDFTIVPGALVAIGIRSYPKGEDGTITIAATDPPQTQQFVATGYDGANNAVGSDPDPATLSEFIVVWNADPLAGLIDQDGLFTATGDIGGYADAIEASVGELVGHASIDLIDGVSVVFEGAYQMRQYGPPLPLEVKLIDTTSGAVTTEIVTPQPVSGEAVKEYTFTIHGVIPGTYDITVKSGNTLRKNKLNVVVEPSMNSVVIETLVLGDFWGDATGNPGENVIDASDYSKLLNLFGSFFEGTDPFLDRADLNRDGVIDASDYSRLIANYNQAGDTDPTP